MKKRNILAIVVGIIALAFVFSIGSIGEDVKNEQIVVNQYPFTGKLEYWTTPGFKWQWFGKTTHYYKTNQLWFGSDNEDGDRMGNPIPVIFNDASDGLIYGSLRVKLPTDVTYLSRIQTDYNGMDRLMQDLVRPTVNKVIYASGPLMSAFESYAEKKNDLIEYITDQLNNGVYNNTRIISENWIEMMTKSYISTDEKFGNQDYGFLWWLPHRTREVIAAIGDGGNIIYVDRKNQIVVAITAHFKPMVFDRVEYIEKNIVEALTER